MLQSCTADPTDLAHSFCRSCARKPTEFPSGLLGFWHDDMTLIFSTYRHVDFWFCLDSFCFFGSYKIDTRSHNMRQQHQPTAAAASNLHSRAWLQPTHTLSVVPASSTWTAVAWAVQVCRSPCNHECNGVIMRVLNCSGIAKLIALCAWFLTLSTCFNVQRCLHVYNWHCTNKTMLN